MTGKSYSVEDVNAHYKMRHGRRAALFGDKPFANYGYWSDPSISIDEACSALTRKISDELAIGPGDEVLECGCGYGASAIQIVSECKPARYVGLDVTDIRIETGQELVKEYGLSDTVTIRFGDATNLDFEDNTFDKLLAIECAFHFNTRRDFFREAFRVLKPGGVLAMTDVVPAKDLDLSAYSMEQLRVFLGADAKMLSDENIYSQADYQGYLEAEGFNPVVLYSIKEQSIPAFSAHLVRSVKDIPKDSGMTPEMIERRLEYARNFKEDFMAGGDYVIVRAAKPA